MNFQSEKRAEEVTKDKYRRDPVVEMFSGTIREAGGSVSRVAYMMNKTPDEVLDIARKYGVIDLFQRENS